MTEDINKFIQKEMDFFGENITDRIFLSIESSKESMQKYLDLVSEHGKNNVNRQIGKEIKRKFGLGNSEKETNPRSKLIKSHTQHNQKEKK